MSDEEYNKRQWQAMRELRKLGLLRAAQKWIHKHRHEFTENFEQFEDITPLEYALEEMPRFAFLRWLGF